MSLTSILHSYFGMSLDRVLRRKVIIEPKILPKFEGNSLLKKYSFLPNFSIRKFSLEIPIDFNLAIKIENVREVVDTVVFEFEPVKLSFNVLSSNTQPVGLAMGLNKIKYTIVSDHVYINYVFAKIKPKVSKIPFRKLPPECDMFMRVAKSCNRETIEWDIPVLLTPSNTLNVTQIVM
jgi:hypothetical protein